MKSICQNNVALISSRLCSYISRKSHLQAFWNTSSRSFSAENLRLQSNSAETQPKKKFKLIPSKVKEVQAGTGIVLERDSCGNMTVAGLLRGGPAYRNGSVLLGDFLVAVDKVPIDALPAREVAFLMQGHAGSFVDLTLKRSPPSESHEASENSSPLHSGNIVQACPSSSSNF